MKTIFITSFHPLISRNILSTGLLEMLSRRARIVLLVPLMKKAYFQERFGGGNVFVEGVDHRLTRRDLFSRRLFLAIADTQTLRIKKRSEFFVHKNPIRFFFSLMPGTIVGHSRLLISLVRFFDRLITDTARLQALFEQYRPDAIFSTDVQNEIDVLCLREARRRKVTRIGMVRSWDNLSAKGIIREIPDTLAVNNEIIKWEAMRWSFVPEKRIVIVGIPHYDRYMKGVSKTREEVLREFGLDSAKKTVLFAPIGERYMPGKPVDQEILATLALLDVNIIVRLPPTDITHLEKVSDTKAHIFFDDAGERSWKRGGSAPSRKASEIGDDDERRLIAELGVSDVVVTGLSTMLIDGAVFDKPLISVCFDKPEWKYWESFRRYHAYDHVRPVLQSGGVRIVYSPEELQNAVGEYLLHPEKDREERKRIVDEQVYRFDGQSTKRLAEIIMRTMRTYANITN